MRPPTAPIAAGSLVAGYAAARASGVRPLGGAVLGTSGIYLGRRWARESGAGAAAGLIALYAASFATSHPLAKRIGAWPAVAAVATISGTASALVADRRRRA